MKPPSKIGDLISKSVDPLLAKRAGLRGALIAQWREIAGHELAEHCHPVKLKWPRTVKAVTDEDDVQEPATLIIVATGMWALKVQHSTAEIIDRINSFFGYRAVCRIAIEQRHVSLPNQKSKTTVAKKPLNKAEQREIDLLVDDVEDEALKETLRKLGQAIKNDRAD